MANMVKRAEERKAQAGDESFKALLADEDKAADLEQAAKVIRTDEDRREAIKRKKEDLRADPDTQALPVLMLTARGQKRDREMAERFGASRFMTKPFSNQEVLDQVRELLGP